MLYGVKLLDTVASLPYTLLYLHHDLPASHQPPLEWVKEVLGLISRYYISNLTSILVLDPSWRLKVQLWTRSFAADKAWGKVGQSKGYCFTVIHNGIPLGQGG